MEEKILSELNAKFDVIGQKTQTHLQGLLYSTPLTYWDYIQVDSLLSLQTQRSTLPDEMVFIGYHQINELLFKMILWEIDQLAVFENITAEVFIDKLGRISRYFDMLTSSFSIMENGMDREQYLKFRDTLTPASGFQSVQYRLIEFGSTNWKNLIDKRFTDRIDLNCSAEQGFDYLYWQAAGKNYQTQEKSFMLSSFEKKYKKVLINAMKDYEKTNLWRKFVELPREVRQDPKLIEAMRHYDKTVNITWVLGHYRAAVKYLEGPQGPKEATGGSDWKKYMLPKYQKRIFFPELWSEKEKETWGG
ncbi:tryptophan 2,3-dioxygenase family protein [Myroides sp. LJL115]